MSVPEVSEWQNQVLGIILPKSNIPVAQVAPPYVPKKRKPTVIDANKKPWEQALEGVKLPLCLGDYLKQNKKSTEGLYTFRITPSNFNSPLDRDEVKKRLKDMLCHPKINKMMAFEEGDDRVGTIKRHYHVRIETGFKTRKSVNDLVRQIFNISSQGGRSSKKYSIHSCALKDKTFWKSKTYCAKQGDVVFHNHTDGEIMEAICWGRRLQHWGSKSKTQRIISCFNIYDDGSECSREKLDDVYCQILLYYKEVENKIPSSSQIKYEMHNIMFETCKHYRLTHRKMILDKMEREFMDYW